MVFRVLWFYVKYKSHLLIVCSSFRVGSLPNHLLNHSCVCVILRGVTGLGLVQFFGIFGTEPVSSVWGNANRDQTGTRSVRFPVGLAGFLGFSSLASCATAYISGLERSE